MDVMLALVLAAALVSAGVVVVVFVLFLVKVNGEIRHWRQESERIRRDTARLRGF